VAAGDLAVSVEWAEEISIEVNTQVRALECLIQQKASPGGTEMVASLRAEDRVKRTRSIILPKFLQRAIDHLTTEDTERN